MEQLYTTDNSSEHSHYLSDNVGRARILLLDDDSTSLRIMQGVLRTAGYECIATHQPQEALTIVERDCDIRVVISDICMPDIDGLMFLDRLHQLRVAWPLPQVLFLTGHPSLDNAVAALRRGAMDFLVKPLKPRALLDAVERACARAAQLASAPAARSWTVEGLAHQAEELALRLRMLTPSSPMSDADNSAALPATFAAAERAARGNETQQRDTTQLLDTIEQLRRLRRRYHAVLGELDDIAWELLIEALRSDRDGKQMSVSGLSISVDGVSSTTALRRINELVARGHLHRMPDPADARRDFIALDAKTRAALEDYLASVAEQLGHTLRASNP